MLEISMDYSHIMQTLKDLPQAMQKEMLDKALKKGADIVKEATLAKLPHDKTGNLRKSLVYKKIKTQSPFLSVATVKFATGGQYKGYHAHLIEQGHYIWKRAKRGKGSVAATGKKYEMVSTGKRTPSRPMLKPAFYSNTQRALEAIGIRLSVKNIEREVLSKIRRREKLVGKR